MRIDRQNPSLVDKTAQEGASVFWHCAVEGTYTRTTAADHIKIGWTQNGRPISELEVGLRAHLKVFIHFSKGMIKFGFNPLFLKEGEFGILRLRRNDTGNYACEAISYGNSTDDSVLERDSVMVHLNVQCYLQNSKPLTNALFLCR